MSPAEHRALPPESYVVRIYRRDQRSSGRIAGTVEIVASGTERSFSSLRELQQILDPPSSPAAGGETRAPRGGLP
jgi:hypothetical protein